ncbi:hypothetical protein NS44R_15105, partial [Mammaliicoccus sciuri]
DVDKRQDRLLEAEAAADHADRAEDRGRIAIDLVARAGDHVAAGGRDVLGEHQHRQFLLGCQLADAQIDLARLHRRAARRIDHQRHRLGIPRTKGALQHLGDAGERHAGPQRRHRAYHARQPHHRHHGRAAPETCGQHSLHAFEQSRTSAGMAAAITYLFTHAVTSN